MRTFYESRRTLEAAQPGDLLEISYLRMSPEAFRRRRIQPIGESFTSDWVGHVVEKTDSYIILANLDSGKELRYRTDRICSAIKW